MDSRGESAEGESMHALNFPYTKRRARGSLGTRDRKSVVLSNELEIMKYVCRLYLNDSLLFCSMHLLDSVPQCIKNRMKMTKNKRKLQVRLMISKKR